jgi:hypothetical protein
MYGRGLQGAEAERLAAAPAVLRQRIYFYIDAGTGINPEAGVGGRAHDVELTNIYDADQDALRILRDSRGPNAFEEAIVRAGFDGYMTRNAGFMQCNRNYCVFAYLSLCFLCGGS